jgi:hypothetical protein
MRWLLLSLVAIEVVLILIVQFYPFAPEVPCWERPEAEQSACLPDGRFGPIVDLGGLW